MPLRHVCRVTAVSRGRRRLFGHAVRERGPRPGDLLGNHAHDGIEFCSDCSGGGDHVRRPGLDVLAYAVLFVSWQPGSPSGRPARDFSCSASPRLTALRM